MALSFRHRILLVLICLGAIPTGIVTLGWVFTIRSTSPAASARAALEEVGGSGRMLLETIDSTRLRPEERQALADHAERLNAALSRSQRADAYAQYYYAGLGVVVLVGGALFLYASIRLGGHLSRQLSRPIEELIGWADHIRRHESLPPDRPRRGAPEFTALRAALREMADDLERARHRELEAERLRAFRETARRVAHEMRNPLTPIRLAVARLARTAAPAQAEPIEVLGAETDRLEQLAREFTEYGRLPEGPAAAVDLCELLEELVPAALPPAVTPVLHLDRAAPPILGHYDPLRRVFANILRNAVEAMDGRGTVEVCVTTDDGSVVVAISDDGPGIRPDVMERIFDPYVTGKAEGTGLGLAMARQTVELHGGRLTAGPGRDGGASFTARFPAPAPKGVSL